ncbi:hypothetical protein D6777_04180 [Candidatus Woesearchaeota archaeon]|nr:MAG: hypothetical protein D6777_04180 [Candidatus Woesearchaeota archaeon]
MLHKNCKMKKRLTRKRGISPLIATVLLTGFTVTAVALIIVWGKAFTGETAEKQEAMTNARLSCENIEYTVTNAKFSGGKLILGLKNKGQQSMDSFVFKLIFPDKAEPIETNNVIGPLDEDQVDIESPELTQKPDKVSIIPKVKVAAGVYLPCTNQERTVMGSKIA